jgi:phosphatidylinositol alpha-1,6-mannosyltransferase
MTLTRFPASGTVLAQPPDNPARRRILLLSRNFPPLLGGMERLNQHVLLELEREYEVHLVGPTGAESYLQHPGRAHTCPATPVSRFLPCATIKGIKVAHRQRPALIIAGSGVNAPPAWAAAKATGARWMVYLHGLDLVVKNPVYQRLFLPIIRRADAWLVNSRATEQLAAAAGLDARRLHILHPAVEIPRAFPSDEKVRAWRDRYGLGDRPLLLSVGRLSKRKGLKEFILHALPAVLAGRPDALLVVVGAEPRAALTSAGVSGAALEEAARTKGVMQSLRVLGRLPDPELARAYRAASVLVFPVLEVSGDIEGFGIVAVEAAAHGLPTVAFAVGGVTDAVEEETSGYLLPPGDYKQMAARIVQLTARGGATSVSQTSVAFASRFARDQFGNRLRDLCRPRIA